MGGSAGMIGRAVQAGGGGKSSGMGQSSYGGAPGFTPVGQTPARTDAPIQQPQQSAQAPQFIPGSAFGGMPGNSGFPSPFGGGFGSGMGGGFGGKSSGLGQMGMMNSPFGGFNPYAQQPMAPQRQDISTFNQQGMGGMGDMSYMDGMNRMSGAQVTTTQDMMGGMRGPMGSAGGFPDPRMQRGMPQQQFNPYAQQPMIGGLGALAQMLRGRMMFNQGGVAKEDDEE